MAAKPPANAELREDLIELAAALYTHDHALIRAVYGRHPDLDVMAAAASLFVDKKNCANYEANIDSLRIRLAAAGVPHERQHLYAYANAGFSYLASYVYGNHLRHDSSAQIVEGTLALLGELGWIPCEQALCEFSQKAIYAQHAAALLWLARRGLRLHAKPLKHGRLFHSLPAAFRTPSANDLAILRELCDLGALRDADGEIGVTDFIAVNAYKAAAVLAAKGFKPRATVCGLAGVNPVCAYINSLRNYIMDDAPSRRLTRSDQATATLEWMAANGANFSPSPALGMMDACWSPFLAASMAIFWGGRQKPGLVEQARKLFSDLKRLGANPNASGGFIYFVVSRLQSFNFDTGFFQAALDVGADPGLHPSEALAAMSCWGGSEPALAEWLGKMAALGATLAKASTSCPARYNPLAAAILNHRIPYANHLLRAGIDSSWKDSGNGATLWHLLAQQSGAFSRPMMALLAKDSATLALIDSSMLDGCTALHLACRALNTAQAKALLNAGANPSLQNSAGESPLHCSGRKFGAKARAKTSDLVTLLMSRGADPSLLNKKGLTAGQAMAKRAPLEGLAILLNARPCDLLGDSTQSLATQASLTQRGAHATSIVESAILGSEGPAGAPPLKATRQRL